MADHDDVVEEEEDQTVCCMCGYVGFPEKLFHCTRCRFRFQHSYCSNYYHGESSSDHPLSQVCDWCQSEEEVSRRRLPMISLKRRRGSLKKPMTATSTLQGTYSYPQYTGGERIKHNDGRDEHEQAQGHEKGDDQESSSRGSDGSSCEKLARNSSGGGVASPRPASSRRYKLLKDIMC